MTQRLRFKPEERVEQILDEAARLIGVRGYYGFTIQDLAQRCGLTNGGLLHYFGSKEGLLIALLKDRDRRDGEVVTAMAGWERGDVAHSFQSVLDLLHATVERNHTQPELIRLFAVLQTEAMNEGHPAYDYFLAREANTLDAFTQLLTPHVAQPRSVARQVAAIMMGLEQQWLRADQGFDLVAEWDRAAANLFAFRMSAQ